MKTSSVLNGGRSGNEYRIATATRAVAEPALAVYPLCALVENAPATSSIAVFGGKRCPNTVGSPCASDISLFSGFANPTISSTIRRMGLHSSFSALARTFHPSL
jgi:hypothetical protein